MEGLSKLPAIGERASLRKSFSNEDVRQFAGISGDTNPIHVDESVAARSRFGKRIVHGMLTAGLISAVLGTRLPGSGAIYLSQSLKFRAPVFIGDTIEAEVVVSAVRDDKRIVTLSTTCRNQAGVTVIEGEAVLVV